MTAIILAIRLHAFAMNNTSALFANTPRHAHPRVSMRALAIGRPGGVGIDLHHPQ